MRRTIILCLISGLLGGLAASVYRGLSPDDLAHAQEPLRQPPRQPAPRFGAPDATADRRSATADSFPATAADVAADELAEFTPQERTNILVYERANQCVVHITTRADRTALLILEVPTEGTGSGSILDRQGHILTNNHVIDGAQEIRVTLASGESYDARVVGRDVPNDIAVLKIQTPVELLTPIELGDSSRLRVGQNVYAIGNPFGLERTMTTGIISSLNRSLPSKNGRTMKSIIQIDAALNRGNSGGPLLDSHGRLIGMNTAIASSTGENTGVGFAIPADSIRRVAAQLIKSGRVIRADAGISHVLPTERGLLVVMLIPGGPAERAGLRGFRIVREQERRGPFVVEKKKVDRSQADLIVSVDGEQVTTPDEFLSLVERHRPGERALLGIVRDGEIVEVPVTLTSEE
jgi:S1-C subfamily serine protease